MRSVCTVFPALTRRIIIRMSLSPPERVNGAAYRPCFLRCHARQHRQHPQQPQCNGSSPSSFAINALSILSCAVQMSSGYVACQSDFFSSIQSSFEREQHLCRLAHRCHTLVKSREQSRREWSRDNLHRVAFSCFSLGGRVLPLFGCPDGHDTQELFAGR
jgi:hypothetical protein